MNNKEQNQDPKVSQRKELIKRTIEQDRLYILNELKRGEDWKKGHYPRPGLT